MTFEDGRSPASLARGELYWDDGETIVTNFEKHEHFHFTYHATVEKKQTSLTITALRKAVRIRHSKKHNNDLLDIYQAADAGRNRVPRLRLPSELAPSKAERKTGQHQRAEVDVQSAYEDPTNRHAEADRPQRRRAEMGDHLAKFVAAFITCCSKSQSILLPLRSFAVAKGD